MSTVRSQLDAAISWMLVVLAALATIPLWTGAASLPFDVPEPTLVAGGGIALAVWLLTFFGGVYRNRARVERARLSIVESRESLVEQPSDDVPERRIGILYLPAWALSIIAVGGACVLRFVPDGQSLLASSSSTFVLGGVTITVWLLALYGVANGARARRFAVRREAVEGRANLARDAFEKMPVMFSVCSPQGDRSNFNPRYIEVMEQSEADLDGVGWFQSVHETDRQNFTNLFRKGNKRNCGTLKIEYGITTPSGENRWIHELFVPHRSKNGELVGYLVSGFDITRQVENETENTQQIQELSEEVEQQREELERCTDQISSLESKAETLTQARDRLEAKVKSAEERISKADERTEKARQETRTVREELKSQKAEHSETKTELRRLTKEATRLEAEVEQLREEAGRARDEAENMAAVIEQHKEDANEARQLESQLRTKVNLLTTRNQELEDELVEAHGAAESAQSSAEQTRMAAASDATDRERLLASSLRTRIDSTQAIIDKLRAGAASDEQVDDLETTLASIASISAYLDGVLGESPRRTVSAGGHGEDGRAFDLRAAVRSVVNILERSADEREVRIRCKIEEGFPTVACGDSAGVREAVLRLGAQIIRSVNDCELSVRLLQSSATSAMLAARIEFSVRGGNIDSSRVKSLLAVVEAPDGSLDEAAQFEREQARAAWDLIRSMQGEFGCEDRDDGLTFWVDMNFARVRASRNERGPVSAKPIVAPAAPESAPVAALPAPTEKPQLRNTMAPLATAKPSAPRLPQEGLQSNFGPILELGQASARIKSTKELKGAVKLFIRVSKTEQIELPVEVESCEKVASRHYDMVVQFIDVPDDQKKRLRQVAMTNRRQTTIASSIKIDP